MKHPRKVVRDANVSDASLGEAVGVCSGVLTKIDRIAKTRRIFPAVVRKRVSLPSVNMLITWKASGQHELLVEGTAARTYEEYKPFILLGSIPSGMAWYDGYWFSGRQYYDGFNWITPNTPDPSATSVIGMTRGQAPNYDLFLAIENPGISGYIYKWNKTNKEWDLHLDWSADATWKYASAVFFNGTPLYSYAANDTTHPTSPNYDPTGDPDDVQTVLAYTHALGYYAYPNQSEFQVFENEYLKWNHQYQRPFFATVGDFRNRPRPLNRVATYTFGPEWYEQGKLPEWGPATTPTNPKPTGIGRFAPGVHYDTALFAATGSVQTIFEGVLDLGDTITTFGDLLATEPYVPDCIGVYPNYDLMLFKPDQLTLAGPLTKIGGEDTGSVSNHYDYSLSTNQPGRRVAASIDVGDATSTYTLTFVRAAFASNEEFRVVSTYTGSADPATIASNLVKKFRKIGYASVPWTEFEYYYWQRDVLVLAYGNKIRVRAQIAFNYTVSLTVSGGAGAVTDFYMDPSNVYAITDENFDIKGLGTQEVIVLEYIRPPKPVSATVSAVVGVPFTYEVQNTDWRGSWALSGSPPAGATITDISGGRTGLISWPSPTAGTTSFYVYASNDGGWGQAIITVNVT